MSQTRVIHKHELAFTLDVQPVEMGRTAEILDVQIQREEIVFWERHLPDMGRTVRYFQFRPTGYDYTLPPDGWENYIGTFQLDTFVGHLFEVSAPRKDDPTLVYSG